MYDPVPEPSADPIAGSPAPSRIFLVQRLGALAEVVLCSGFPTQVFLAGLLMAAGLSIRTDDGQLSPGFVFTLSLLDTMLVIGLILILLTAHGERPRDVLLGRRPVRREAILGAALLPLVFVLLLLVLGAILTFAPWMHNVPRNPLEDMLQNRRDAITFAVVATLAGGVREEIQRGFILHRFERFLGGGAVGIVAHSALFGLGHYEQGIDASIAIATLGAVWGVVYLTRRSIVAPMVCHSLFNLAQLVKFGLVR
jgi:membrane protease YdiL (CAAX protease family)